MLVENLQTKRILVMSMIVSAIIFLELSVYIYSVMSVGVVP